MYIEMVNKISKREKILSAISYIPIVNIIVISYRDEKFVNVNFNQAISIIITEVIILLLSDILFMYIGVDRNMIFIVILVLLPFNIIAIFSSLRGKYLKIPGMGWSWKDEDESYEVSPISRKN